MLLSDGGICSKSRMIHRRKRIGWTCDIPNTVDGFGDDGTTWK